MRRILGDKKLLPLIWLFFAGVFFILGCIHIEQSKQRIEPIKLEFKKGTIGAWNGLPTGISDIEDFSVRISDYIEDYNASTRTQNLTSAVGYFIAFLTALFSMYLSGKKEE